MRPNLKNLCLRNEHIIGGPSTIPPWMRTGRALKGAGKRLIKGTKEAKERMAYLRSLRGKKAHGGFMFWKPSKPPKPFREKAQELRTMLEKSEALRKKLRERKAAAATGGELPTGVTDLLTMGVNNWVDWGKQYQQERDAQIAEIQRLENLRYERRRKAKGRVDINSSTLSNIARGPAGWIRLIGRSARQRKIDALKKELGLA